MTARRVTWVLAVVGVLFGFGHMAFLAAAPRWALDVLWFALSGVAFIVTALLNVAALRAPGDRLIRALAVGADLVLAGVFAAAWLVLPAPQVVVGGVLFASLAVLSGTVRPRPA